MCNCVKETEHITPVLMTLHSLPITVSVNFKILHVTFKSPTWPGSRIYTKTAVSVPTRAQVQAC